jgi:hypothetical protein
MVSGKCNHITCGCRDLESSTNCDRFGALSDVKLCECRILQKNAMKNFQRLTNLLDDNGIEWRKNDNRKN